MKHTRAKASRFSSIIAISSKSSTLDLLVIRSRAYYACTWLLLLFVIWRWYLYISSVLIYGSISSLASCNQLLNWFVLLRFIIHMTIPQEVAYFLLAFLVFLIILVLVLNLVFSIFLNCHKCAGVWYGPISCLLPRSFCLSNNHFITWAACFINLSEFMLFHVFGKWWSNVRSDVLQILVLWGCSLHAFFEAFFNKRTHSMGYILLWSPSPLNTTIADETRRYWLISYSLIRYAAWSALLFKWGC